jgi:hypothetical protein
MNDYRAQLGRAVDNAGNGRRVGSLAAWLYDRWYAPASGDPAPRVPVAQLVGHYRAVDAAGQEFENGWSVLDGDQARGLVGPAASIWQVAVCRGSEVRWVDPVDLHFPAGVGLRPQPGDVVAVAGRRDHVDAGGWWSTMSSGWQEERGTPTLRAYWAVEPAHVVHLAELLTSALARSVSYALKCPLDLERCRRPDGVVVYVLAEEWPAIERRLASTHQRSARWLRPTVPALTLPVARGVAIAEDPIGDSFGSSRCRIVADALEPHLATPAHPSRSALVAALEDAFARHGIDLAAPWRNPGSTRNYGWPR